MKLSNVTKLIPLVELLHYGDSFQKKDHNRSSHFEKPENQFNARNKGLLIDGFSYRISENDSFEHLILVAPPGSGKTTKYVIPNLFTLSDNKCSIIINDPSGEIYAQTSQFMFERGYNVLCIDPVNISRSVRYNPLQLAQTYIKIKELTEILMAHGNNQINNGTNNNDPFWKESSANLMYILSRCLNNMDPNLNTLSSVLDILNRFQNDGSNIDPLILKHAPNEDIKLKWNGFKTAPIDTILSIKSIISAVLNITSDPSVEQLLTTNSFSFNDLNDTKTVLYLIPPISKEYRFIFDIFYTQFLNNILEQESRYRGVGLPIYFLIDEFGNTIIPNFENIITQCRKYRVSISIILQSYSQLKDKYGETGGTTIWSAFGSKLFYGGLDMQTASLLEALSGKMIFSNFRKTSYSEADLVSASEIRRMEDAIFLQSSHNPVKLVCHPFYTIRRFKRYAKRGIYTGIITNQGFFKTLLGM